MGTYGIESLGFEKPFACVPLLVLLHDERHDEPVLLVRERAHPPERRQVLVDRRRGRAPRQSVGLVALDGGGRDPTKARGRAEVAEQVREPILQRARRPASVGSVVSADHLRRLVQREPVARGADGDVQRHLALALAEEISRLPLARGLG